MLETIEVETGDSPQRSIIWMHGLGADGNDFVPIVPELKGLPAIRFVFPHAPVRPVTLNGGMPMRAWYDILSLDRAGAMDLAGLKQSAQDVNDLIDVEVDRGVPTTNIMLAGFSQGGAVALYAGLRHVEPLAGVIGLSTYLPDPESLGKERSSANESTEIFLAHGSVDPVLPVVLGSDSKDQLEAQGYSVEWHEYAHLPHSVSLEEIADLSRWLSQRYAG